MLPATRWPYVAVICAIQTRRQLDTFVRAAAAKTGGYIMVGVISAAAK
jgi:hypothetical protein